MDLDNLADFILAARHGGFGAASRAAVRSKASIARRVADLERSLAVRLFERGHAGLKLTDAGRQLFDRVAGPFQEIQEATHAVSRDDGVLRGRLRISAAVVFAHAHLARIAATFARLHPEVEIEIVADDGTVDLVEDGFDIVVRANPSPSEQLVGRCIVRTNRVAVAAPGLAIPGPSDAAPLVYRSVERPPASWRLSTEHGPRELLLRPAMSFSSLMMIREAAIHGAGVALLPHTLVADDLAEGRLACWGVETGGVTEIWVLHASSRLASPKVIAFLRHLQDAFRLPESARSRTGKVRMT